MHDPFHTSKHLKVLLVVERDWDWGPLGGKASQAHSHHTLVQEGYSTLAHPVLQPLQGNIYVHTHSYSQRKATYTQTPTGLTCQTLQLLTST